MLVGSLIGADLDSSVLSDNNADLADIRNLNEQTLAVNTLSDELAVTHKLFSGFCLEQNLLNQALAYTNKYTAENLRTLGVYNQISRKYSEE